VETGLDLLAFPTLYFYETGYSLHTLRQASRRSWRIGQRHPVRVKFVILAAPEQVAADAEALKQATDEKPEHVGGGLMQTIIDIIGRAGGWRSGLYLRIENPPYIPLVIEAPSESAPLGLPAISVAHYTEKFGESQVTAKDVAITILCSILLLAIAIPAAWATEKWMEREGQKVANHMMIWREPIETWSQ
jgi:hypothetical protein